MNDEQRKEAKRIVIVAIILGLLGACMMATVEPSQELIRFAVGAML
jgi:hypothetical protein